MYIVCIMIALASLDQPTFDHEKLNTVLAKYVENGLVDYAGLKQGRAQLDACLAEAGAIPVATFQRWNKQEQLAFLINIYNATTLQLIIDHYPLKSIKSIGSFLKGPWDRESVALFGNHITLDTLEHKIIRKNYSEPRIHFALVCAAMGCPPLRSEAYQGARLDEQLEDQAREFLDDASKNRLDKEQRRLWLSPIFKWYSGDFEAAAGSVQAYVAPFLELNETPIGAVDVSYTDYDWSLNDKSKSTQ